MMLIESNDVTVVAFTDIKSRKSSPWLFLLSPPSALNIIYGPGIFSKLSLLFCICFLSCHFAGISSASLVANLSAPECIDICEPEVYSVIMSSNEQANDLLLTVDLPEGFVYSGESRASLGECSSQREPSPLGRSLRWDLSSTLKSCRHVVINELDQNPKGSDSGKEWIELYNPSSSEVNIGGWRLVDSYYRKTVVLPQDASLSPGSYAVVVWTNSSLINSRPLSLCLLDAAGRTVDCTPSLMDEEDDDRSWARVADGEDLDADTDWAFQASTKGSTNGRKSYDIYPGEAFSLVFGLTAGCKAIAGQSIHAAISSTAGSSPAKSPPLNIKRANLSLSCTSDRFEAAKGDRVTWQISIKNNGNGTARNILINASLSSGLELLSIDSPNRALSWSYDSLGPAEVAEVELKTRAISSCDSYYNLINISWGCGPCQMLGHQSEIGRRTALRKQPDGLRSVAIGEEADFQIETDLPPGGLRNMWINDSLPSGLEYSSGSFYCKGATLMKEVLDTGSCEHPGTSTCWFFGDQISAASIDLGYRATVANLPENQNGLLMEGNVACMSWSGLNSDCDEAGAITIVEPDLVLEAATSSSAGDTGDEIAYTLSVFHSGDSSSNAFDVDLQAELPSGLSYSPGSAMVLSGPKAAFDPSSLKWHFDSLDLGWNGDRKVLLRYNATIIQALPGDILGNNATLTWSSMPGDNPWERDGSGGVNDYLRRASSQVNVMRLLISKQASPDYVSVGELLTYTLTYENQGSVAARNVTLIDELDSNLFFISSSPPGNAGNTTWEIPLLQPDGPHRIEIDAIVAESLANGTRLLNRFSIESDEISPVRGAIYTDVLNGTRLGVNKTALQKTVRRGEEVTYAIKVCNHGGQKATNVTVRDVFDSRIELVSASPPFEDGTGVWHFDSLDPGMCIELELVVRIPREDVEFTAEQKINGSGFLRVSRDYTTSLQPFVLTNAVFVTSDQDPNNLDTEKVTIIGEAGTDLKIREHGSGRYDSIESLRFLSANKSLEMDRLLKAHHQPTSFKLPGNRSENLTSRWSEVVHARNGITESSFQESYRHAMSLDSESSIHLDENGSEIRLLADLQGQSSFGISKKASKRAKGAEDIFESREEYAGGFKVQKSFEEHGKNIFLKESLTGVGYASVDKRVKDRQRSYEVGTGSINMEETIQSSTGFLSKEIDVRRAALSYPLTPDTDTTLKSSMEWREGLWSRGQGSFLEERYFSVERLKKVAMFRGFGDLESEADFSGRTQFRVAYKDGKNESKKMDLTDEFVGEFYLKRRILLAGISKYDRPHLSLLLADNSDLVNSSHVRYTLTVKNDGNAALGPIYLRDLFPPGTEYIGSSVGPSELTPESANWTLLSLGIGGSSSIELELNATEEMESIVNRVEAAAGHDGQWISVGNFSAVQLNWLPCSTSEILVSKEGAFEPGAENIVGYRISLHNPRNCTIAASVVDALPAGLRMLGSSMLPSDLDSNSNRATWKIIDLLPGQTRTIEYRAQALQSGILVNRVRVEAFAVGGSGSAVAEASAEVEVNGGKSGDINGWKPPGCFGLNYSAPCAGDDLAACYSCGATAEKPEILCAGCISPEEVP
jgi:uncharacterized repeat protein (TIGR01451 family)